MSIITAPIGNVIIALKRWCRMIPSVFILCIAAKRAAPPKECGGAWAYMARLDQHRSHPPFAAMLVAADAVRALLDADPQTSGREAVREAVGGLDALQDAVDCLEGITSFSPSTSIAASSMRTCAPGPGREERSHEGHRTGRHTQR